MAAQGYTITILSNSGSNPVFNNGLLGSLSLKAVDPVTGNLTGAVYPATAFIGNGQYDFGDIPYGSYKLYNNDDPVTGFHGTGAHGKWIGASSYNAAILDSGTLDVDLLPEEIPLSKIGNGTVTSDEFDALIGVEGNIQNLLDLKAPTESANPTGQWEFSENYPKVDSAIEAPTHVRHVTTKDYVDTADALALHKAGAETITGNKNLQASLVVDTANNGLLTQSVYQAPSDSRHYSPKKYVDDRINSILSGLTVPLTQQSDKLLRVIYGGTSESGRVFTSIGGAIAYAALQPLASNTQYFVYVEKDGADTAAGSGSILSDIYDYVHIIGQHRNMIIYGADDALAATGLGRTVIKDCTLKWVSGATATPSFTNIVFENVTFDIADNSLELNNCHLFNCRVKSTTNGYTLTNCSGNELLIDYIPTISGYAPALIVNTAYNQRQLGIKGDDVASATGITLPNLGNFFNITGTTDIETIAVTNWTDGSEITLRFTNNLTLVNSVTTGHGELFLQGATSYTVHANDTIKLILDNSTWYEVSRSTNS